MNSQAFPTYRLVKYFSTAYIQYIHKILYLKKKKKSGKTCTRINVIFTNWYSKKYDKATMQLMICQQPIYTLWVWYKEILPDNLKFPCPKIFFLLLTLLTVAEMQFWGPPDHGVSLPVPDASDSLHLQAFLPGQAGAWAGVLHWVAKWSFLVGPWYVHAHQTYRNWQAAFTSCKKDNIPLGTN